MNLYERMLNIKQINIENTIKQIINKNKQIIPNTTGMCQVASNLIYNDLQSKHIPSRIINTKELGLGYEHEFLLVKDIKKYFLIDITYDQFLISNTILNKELLNNGYIIIDNNTLTNYLNSIPNTFKIDYIDIDEVYLPSNNKQKK